MPPRELRLPGAVDLSALRRPPATSPPPDGDAPSGGIVIDVSEATFEAEVINRSMQVPVIIDFWATWCEPCKQLSPVLERAAAADAGRWVLAKIDVDAEQRLAQAFQVQSIPTVVAVIGGQPVPLFQGALAEGQVREVIDEVLKVAAANGVTGTVTVADGQPEPPPPPPVDPVYAEAQASLERGDIDAALAAYRTLLERDPGDVEAKLAVARCELLVRTRGADETAIRAQAAEQPDAVAAQTAAADLDMVRGQVDEAFARLIDLVRRSAGDERDQARQHLLGLFEVLDPEDPTLVASRRALANALF